jgi:hypothetical protein
MSEVKQYTLNELAAAVILQLSRTANSLEAIEAAVKAGKLGGGAAAPAAKPADAPKETAAEKKKRLADEEAAKNAAAAPKATRADVNALLIKIKDTFSKEDAQAVFKEFGYEAMSKIEEKDFDAVLAAAEAKLVELEAGNNLDNVDNDDL